MSGFQSVGIFIRRDFDLRRSFDLSEFRIVWTLIIRILTCRDFDRHVGILAGRDFECLPQFICTHDHLRWRAECRVRGNREDEGYGVIYYFLLRSSDESL